MVRASLVLTLFAGCPEPTEGTDGPVGNALPTIAGVTIGPEDPSRADVLTAELGAVSDEDGDEVGLSYAWMLNGEVAGTEPTLGPDTVRRGDVIELVITPSDGTGDGEPIRSNTLTGRNNEPTIDGIAISPSPLLTDDLAAAEVEASDWDGDEVTVRYVWRVNGTEAGTSATLDGTAAFDRGDTVTLTATADDGQAQTPSGSPAEVVVGNTAPTAPGLAIAPADPASGEAVVCLVQELSVDADGDPITYRFSWTLNGSPMTDTSTTTWADDTARAGSWADGQRLVCQVTASDGTDNSEVARLSVSGVTPPCDSEDATVVEDGAGRTYVICDELQSWANAEAQCQSMGEEWHLASVRSRAENDFLRDALVGTVLNAAGNPFAWIGYTDEAKEGSWVWTDGDPSTFVNWIDPEPNGGDSQNCVMFRGGSTWNGTWNDIGCSNTNPYVCTRAE